MRKSVYLKAVLIAAIVTGWAGPDLLSAMSDSEQGKNFSAVKADHYLETVKKRYGIPGMAAAVIQHGKKVFEKYSGKPRLGSRIAVNENTVFKLYSLSKVFCSVAVFQLAEKQLIDINAPLGNYLENVPEQWKKILVRNLLCHRSGLPDIYRYSELPDKEALKRIVADPVQGKQGERFQYNQTNYWLLSQIIAGVSGMTYEDYLKKNQFDRAGMTDTGLNGTYPDGADAALGYEKAENGALRVREVNFPKYMNSAGNINSTLGDLVRWNRALDENRLLLAKTKAEMWAFAGECADNCREYGLGWDLIKLGGLKTAGHTGGTHVGLRKSADGETTVILLTNGYYCYSNPENLMENLAAFFNRNWQVPRNQLFEKMIEHYLQGEDDAALDCYRKFKKRPDARRLLRGDLLNEMGYQLLGLEKNESAIQVFKLNIKEHPKNWNGYDSLGEALLKAGRLESARKNYCRALELNPENLKIKKILKDLKKRIRPGEAAK